jgi:hypothetical protein
MKDQILPVLSTEVLQEKATEAAMKGAIQSIEEYYTGWNSPYKKMIEEQLSKTEISANLNLPDIVSIINESLSKEIDLIANTAVAKTFIPLVQRFLVREEKEVNFSEILKKFIEVSGAENSYDCEVDIKESTHGWLDIELTSEDQSYSVTLHQDYKSRNEEVKKYCILSLPSEKPSNTYYSQTMKVSLDGVTLEMPFVKDVLQDEFVSYIARLVMGKCLITMDCDSFDEDMFERDECCC